ncbi:polysaccharide biosynthesis/export family protein [Rhizomicrobium electricum]|uniref:Soluble ligand binding domain-containing protein n=1 Tax=Rhizomicrobium electricum TaxID=480070 RepID=A0ABP3PNJ1_9PROT|nr:polysaccharide biosynthesis/export family protein [Rhizomicrobium electricum]NIJ48852.1 protein involved in polysaccharide export with SLBB domain [Rhizomicrobium electricum]
MAWRTLLIAVAFACAGSAWAADTREVTEVSLSSARVAQAAPSPLRPSEGMPRYATMNPPPAEEVPGAPVAAPTAKVNVAPAPPVSPAAAQAPQPRAAAARSDEQVTIAGIRPSEDTLYRLGPGDKVRVTIFNEADLSGEFAIDGQGFVRLPLVGQVQAAGQTSFSLEGRIGETFVNGGFLLNPRVSVEIVTYRPFYIIGEVAKPGEYAYVDAMTAPNAIALAGGYTERAVESTIWIRHLGESKERAMRVDETTRIRPGDVIRVERTAYWALMSILSPLISPFATTAYLLK